MRGQLFAFFSLKYLTPSFFFFKNTLKMSKFSTLILMHQARAIFCILKLGWWHGFGANDNGWSREVASALAAPPELPLDQGWKKYLQLPLYQSWKKPFWPLVWTQLKKKNLFSSPFDKVGKILLNSTLGQSWKKPFVLSMHCSGAELWKIIFYFATLLSVFTTPCSTFSES